MKILKTSMLVIAFMLCFVFSGNVVNAAEINSVNDFKTLFDGKKVTFNETTITLNEDVDVDDVIELNKGEYTLNLNGYTFKAVEIYVNAGKLTIDDSTKKGKVDTAYLFAEEGATLVINQGIFETDRVEQYDESTYEIDTIVDNWGTLTIKNAIIESGLWNSGNLTVEYAEVPYVNQYGNATIKDGKYYCFLTDMGLAKTTIYKGEFVGSVEENYAFILQDTKLMDEYTINNLFAEGCVAKFDDFYSEETEPDSDGIIYHTALYGPSVKIVKDVDTYSDVFKKITTDGTWKIEAFKPTTAENSEFLFSSIIGDILKDSGYEGYGYCDFKEFNPEQATICIIGNDGEFYEEHKVKVEYIAPDKNTLNIVNTTLNKMKKFESHEDMTMKNAYRLEDLHLINYLVSNKDSNKINGAEALNFAKDLIEATNGANISFKLDARAGSGYGEGIEKFDMGQAIVYYNGVAYTTTNAALATVNLLYIPSDTKDTDDAYIAAAMKRINDYLGSNNGISIKVGDTLESIEYTEDWAKGKKYYNVTINNKTYKFIIIKKDISKIETPKYVASDLTSNISITSNVTTIPLDTAITVKEVEETKKTTISKVLGTNTYVAYDISLYSNSKKTSISKLDNGNFSVSIPVPEILKNKELIVYYISDNGDKQVHDTVVKDGIVTFETNHFSTYVIAEKVKDVTPSTGTQNNLFVVLAIGMLAIFGITLVNKVEKVNVK